MTEASGYWIVALIGGAGIANILYIRYLVRQHIDRMRADLDAVGSEMSEIVSKVQGAFDDISDTPQLMQRMAKVTDEVERIHKQLAVIETDLKEIIRAKDPDHDPDQDQSVTRRKMIN